MLEAASPPSIISSARSGKSAPVTTAFTPGSASAFAVSMRAMRAWAMRAALDAAVQHARHDEVGAERGAAGHLVDAVGPDRPGADDVEVRLRRRTI